MARIPFGQIVMGMNSRNERLISVFNPREAIALVNSKLQFKKLLAKNDILTPEVYDRVRSIRDIVDIPWEELRGRNIAVKPDRGFGGHGIIVLRWNRRRKTWLRSNGREFNQPAIERHVRDILDGQYSKGNVADWAFFEEMIVPHRFFRQLTLSGLSDIRVVVYNGVPIMAMLRVPTMSSGGRANLHAGGLGIGVDIGSGITTTAIHFDQLIAVHPDNGMILSDLKVPKWSRVLELAIQTQRLSGLGYAGVDIVIDKHSRVLVLEANARPGLAIQLANMTGLNDRVTRVRNLKVHSVDHGLRLANELFSEREDTRLKVSKKPIIGRVEPLTISHPSKPKSVEVMAKIDTGADSTSISFPIARKIGYKDILDHLLANHVFEPLEMSKAYQLVDKMRKTEFFQTNDDASLRIVKSATGVTIRAYLPVRLTIQKRSFSTFASVVDRSYLSHPIIVGTNDLGGFYVDPTS